MTTNQEDKIIVKCNYYFPKSPDKNSCYSLFDCSLILFNGNKGGIVTYEQCSKGAIKIDWSTYITKRKHFRRLNE